MRIAFFGLPLAATLLARDGHDIAWAGVLVDKGLRRLEKHVAPARTERMPDLERAEVVARIARVRPELLVSWFWVKPVPPAVLAIAPAVGVHPSLLPRHRGPDPYFWALDAGDETTGVTAHLLERDYDTGPVLARREVRIDPLWDAWKLARVLDRPSLAVLRQVVRAYAEGRPPQPVKQDDALATAAPAPTEEDLALRWSWSAERLARRVRAAAPFPGAWTEIGDALVILTRVRPTSDFPRVLEPGEAAVRRDGIAVVRAADAALELLAGRAEDDETPLGAPDLAGIVASAASARQ